MRQLTLKDTQALVDKYVRSFGQRGAAKKLTEHGYRSPEGHDVRQGHISRVQAGSYTMLQAPEEPPIEVIPAPVSTPIAARPPIPEKTPARYLERGPALASHPKDEVPHPLEEKTTIDPREELLNEEADRKEREENSPPEVPRPGDYSRSEHAHPQSLARPHAVFSRRGPVEIKTDGEGNEETFFGIPRLVHKTPATTSRPYEPKSFGQNVVSTR